MSAPRSPDGHYREAQRLLRLADDYRLSSEHYLALTTRAVAHATLALYRPAPAKRESTGPVPTT